MNLKVKLISIFILSLLITSCENQETKLPYKHYQTIDSLMSSSNHIGIFNGSITVSKKDTTIYNKSFGYADGSFGKKIDNLSIYSIGSIAKEFNATSIMILADKELLNLEDSVNKFNLGLPEWSKKIKIKHLLSYTSGLPRIDYENSHNDNDVYNDLKSLKKLEFESGTSYNYNNNSVFLQKRIIEKISGQNFEDFVTENILNPIELKSAVFDPNANNKQFVRAFNNEKQDDPKVGGPASGWVHISNTDLHKYLVALHKGKIISEKSLLFLASNKFQNKGGSLGRCEINDNEIITHYHQGSSYNFESLIYHNSKLDLSITMTTNNKNFKLGEIADAIENIVQGNSFEMPKKSVYLTIREICYDNVDKGIEYYYELKKQFPDNYNFSNSSELNRVGYKLIEKGQIKDAIKVFKVLVKEFPNESNAYDSLGEALLIDKQYDKSKKNYEKALELNPKSENAKEKIEEITNR